MNKQFQDFKLVLAAGVEQKIRFKGFSAFTILDNTSPVSVKAENGSYQTGLNAGDGFDEIDIDDLSFLSAVSQTIRVRLSNGFQRTGTTVNVNATAQVEVSNSNPAIPDVSATAAAKTLIAAANADRKALIIKSPASNPAEGVRVGNSATVAANAGALLDAGESMTIESTAAVYVWNLSATTAATMTMTEAERI